VATHEPAPAPAPAATPEPKPAAAGGANVTRQAQSALERGDMSKAIEYARAATSRDPSNAEAWLTLGAAYEASGRAGLARNAYRSCVAKGKGDRVEECRALMSQ
jgi:Flp pilus assembly protein TadD